MFPKFIDVLPPFYKEDAKAIYFAQYMDDILGEIWGDIVSLTKFLRADTCPAIWLDELGYLLNAGILNTDSETTKRKKIYNATKNLKYRSTFDFDVALRIQAITGILPVLWGVTMEQRDDWLIFGHEADDPDTYAGTFGKDGIDNSLGIWLVGDMTEPVIAGNVYIDLGTSTLTTDQISQIVKDLSNDVLPAFFRNYLGYTTAGVFTVYSGGIIG